MEALTDINLFYSLLGVFFVLFWFYKSKEAKHWTNRKIFQKGKPDLSIEDIQLQNRNHVLTHRYGVFYIAWIGVFFSVFTFGISWEAVAFCITLSGMYMVFDLLLNMKMHSYDKKWGIWHLGDELWDRIAPWPVRFAIFVLGIVFFHLIPLIEKLTTN